MTGKRWTVGTLDADPDVEVLIWPADRSVWAQVADESDDDLAEAVAAYAALVAAVNDAALLAEVREIVAALDAPDDPGDGLRRIIAALSEGRES